MKYIFYPIVGFLLGGILGLLVSGGELHQMNKTERGRVGEFSNGFWGLLGGIIGAVSLGMVAQTIREDDQRVALEKKESDERQRQFEITRAKYQQIKRLLGLRPHPETKFTKQGRYWEALTKWLDTRSGIEYSLRTMKSSEGIIFTTLNGHTVLSHLETSASKERIPILHSKVRHSLFAEFIRIYELDELFDLMKSLECMQKARIQGY